MRERIWNALKSLSRFVVWGFAAIFGYLLLRRRERPSEPRSDQKRQDHADEAENASERRAESEREARGAESKEKSNDPSSGDDDIRNWYERNRRVRSDSDD